MPRPPLTRSRIVTAGLDIAIEQGLPGLNVRAVARRVNATATGVQRHIGPTELVDAVVGELLDSMPQVPERGEWTRRIRQWAIRTRTWLSAYPGLARYLLDNRWDTSAAFDRLEVLVEVLAGAGLTPLEQVRASNALYWYVLSSTDLDQSARIIGSDLLARRMVDSPERWPRLSAHASDSSAAAIQAQFLFGFDLLIDGLAKHISKEPHQQSAKPATLP